MTAELEHLQANQFYGRGLEHMFPEQASTAPAPWPRAHKYRDTKPYDEERVRTALVNPPQIQEVDPRNLHSTQPNITRTGVEYYAGDVYHRTGRTYAQTQGKGHDEGNTFPVVYRREADPRAYSNEPQNLILSGHHRAAAALAEGRPLRARVVEGPWGSKRSASFLES